MNTDALRWKELSRRAAEAAAVDLELPSGMTIRARRPGPAQFALWGRLPLQMVPAAGGESGGGDLAGAAELAEFLRNVLLYCCVSPRVSLDPRGDDEIHPRDIANEDFDFILAWALRTKEAQQFDSFRGGRADAGPGGDGEDLRRAAECAALPGGPGYGSGF